MYTLMDLFCGAGGLSLGFCLSNKFQLLTGIDKDGWALKTFYQNHPEAIRAFTQPQDLSQLDGQLVLRNLGVANVDVIVGGPPCQGFSIAGKRLIQDDRNQLVWEFFRLIKEILPKVFIMENVPGLLLAQFQNGEKLIEVLKTQFGKLGYKVSLWNLNSVDYGVPQVRKRTFLTGIQGSASLSYPEPTNGDIKSLFPTHLPICTVREALGDLPEPTLEEPQVYSAPPQNDYQAYLRLNSFALYNHIPSAHKAEMIEKLTLQEQGTRLYPNWNHSWYRLNLENPSPTVKENHRAPFVHPTQPRVTTPRECARLQSFPDRYIFCGTKTAQLSQIGNAVPPLLAHGIALEVAKALDALQIKAC